MYSIIMATGTIIRNSDNKVVAPCQSDQDPDFLAYNAWANAGNNPTELAAPFDLEAIIAECQDAVQLHLDATARSRNYDGILSLCSYATSKNPKFAREGQGGVEFRDNCWAKCYEIMTAVLGGQRSMITVEELISEMPKINWG